MDCGGYDVYAVREVGGFAVGVGEEGGVYGGCVVCLAVACGVLARNAQRMLIGEYRPLAPQSLTEEKRETSQSAYCGCDLVK